MSELWDYDPRCTGDDACPIHRHFVLSCCTHVGFDACVCREPWVQAAIADRGAGK